MSNSSLDAICRLHAPQLIPTASLLLERLEASTRYLTRLLGVMLECGTDSEGKITDPGARAGYDTLNALIEENLIALRQTRGDQ